MNLYAYCISDRIPGSELALEGISGAAVRFMEIEGLYAAVSDVSMGGARLTRDNVLRHQAVVNEVLAHTTPLPFRFGSVADEEGTRRFISSNRSRLLDSLARVRDSVEMGVKIIRGPSGNRVPAPEEIAGLAQEAGPGTVFLAGKRRELLGDPKEQALASEIDAWLDGRLGDAVAEKVVNATTGSRIIYSAAHLVRRDRLVAYRDRVEAALRERQDLRFMTSGIWAPYTFSSLAP